MQVFANCLLLLSTTWLCACFLPSTNHAVQGCNGFWCYPLKDGIGYQNDQACKQGAGQIL
jgi:hypothetical protein